MDQTISWDAFFNRWTVRCTWQFNRKTHQSPLCASSWKWRRSRQRNFFDHTWVRVFQALTWHGERWLGVWIVAWRGTCGARSKGVEGGLKVNMSYTDWWRVRCWGVNKREDACESERRMCMKYMKQTSCSTSKNKTAETRMVEMRIEERRWRKMRWAYVMIREKMWWR